MKKILFLKVLSVCSLWASVADMPVSNPTVPSYRDGAGVDITVNPAVLEGLFWGADVNPSKYYMTQHSVEPDMTMIHNYDPIAFPRVPFAVRIPVNLLSDAFQKDVKKISASIVNIDVIMQRSKVSGSNLFDVGNLRPHYSLCPLQPSNAEPLRDIAFNLDKLEVYPLPELKIDKSDRKVIVHGPINDAVANYRRLSPNNLEISINGVNLSTYMPANPDQSVSLITYVKGNGREALTYHFIMSSKQQDAFDAMIASLTTRPSTVGECLNSALALEEFSYDNHFKSFTDQLLNPSSETLERDVADQEAASGGVLAALSDMLTADLSGMTGEQLLGLLKADSDAGRKPTTELQTALNAARWDDSVGEDVLTTQASTFLKAGLPVPTDLSQKLTLSYGCYE